MCSLFTQKFKGPLKFYETVVKGANFDTKTIGPYRKAGTLHASGDQFELKEMMFSLVPSWSKTAKLKYSTHNARLDTVDTLNSYKSAFAHRHCIVPMSGFFESSLWGPPKGHMLYYDSPTPLFAAAIWEECVLKPSGELIESFSMITHDPIPLIWANGHHRSPLFLSEENAAHWLRSADTAPAELKKWLAEHQLAPDLNLTMDRKLKDGWQDRIPEGLKVPD